MKTLTHNGVMKLPIAIVGKLNARLAMKFVGYSIAAVITFYVVGGIGMIIYAGTTSPEVQQAISEVENPALRTAFEIVF